MSQRIERINKLIRQIVSQLLLREIDFDDILVTITRVDTSADLRQSKIKICVLPQDKSELALRIIQRNIYQIQQELNKKLDIKYVPKLVFELDQIEIKAQRIEEILTKKVEK